MRDGLPIIAICGPSRCGKDTACEWLRDNTNLRFVGGCSWTARQYIAERMSQKFGRPVSVDEAYADRHKNKMLWYQWLCEYRSVDRAALVRDVLKQNDLVCGIRDYDELLAAKNERLLDLVVWIARPSAEEDETLTFGADECDIIVMNNSNLDVYLRRLRNLAAAMRLLKS